MPIGEVPERDRTRSELERIFLRLCRRHKLPPPRVNEAVGPHVVDFLWPRQKLVVETDGYRFHRGRAAFERDRNRDMRLKTLGFEVMRLSYKQIVEDEKNVALALRVALAA